MAMLYLLMLPSIRCFDSTAALPATQQANQNLSQKKLDKRTTYAYNYRHIGGANEKPP
jgi:hypothetical protein